MNGIPYEVAVNKRIVGKIVNDPNLSAEKLAVLSDVDKVIANAEYVGSGEYEQKGKQKDTIRFDYFETPASINGQNYIVAFDVEVFSSTNNYRTHKLINEMDLIPVSSTDAGPVPTANIQTPTSAETGAESSPNNSIPQGGEKSNGEFEENFGRETKVEAAHVSRSKLETAREVTQILSSAYGVKFAEFDGDSRINGFYDAETRTIHINRSSAEPVLATIGHELLHDLKINDPEAFRLLQRTVRNDMDMNAFGAYREGLLEAYAAIGKDYSHMTEEALSEHVLEEAMADLCAEVLRDPRTIADIARADRKLAQKLIDKLEEIISRIREAFSAYFGGEDAEIRQLVRNFEEVKEVYQSVLENSAKLGSRSGGIDNGIKESIKVLPDGRRYVQADEQVIRSSDEYVQKYEVMSYIKKKVMNGETVKITLDDGETISITGRTAWKLADKGKLDDDFYLVKGNAAGVIDEIIQTSRYENHKLSLKEHSGDFASQGFDYRTAYFRDLDGGYYRLTLSIGVNKDGKEAYNIGKIKKIPFPEKSVSGSKAIKGKVSFDNSIPQKDSVVNTELRGEISGELKFSVSMDFKHQVDAALDGKLQSGYSVYAGNTPKLLQKCGLKNLPMLMHQGHLRAINAPKSQDNIHLHGLSSLSIRL